jgi:glycosyltransferase involved in cell wall biosynthesis
MKPIVSIITPSFNRADLIGETADSIFKQSYFNWEWIIVDDGSTDHSWELLEQYAAKDDRVKIFKRDRSPKGACTCRNIAVEKSTGDYLIFLDTDDLLASFCIEQRLKAIQKHPSCDFLIFPMLLFKKKPDDLRLLWNVENGRDDIERILIGDPICQGTGTLWKKKSFIGIGMWDESLLLWQDIDLHLRSLLLGMKYAKCLDLRPDVFLRISEISLSRTAFHSLPKLRSRMEVLKKTVDLIISNKIFFRYKEGLRHMFLDIYKNAVQGRYFTEVYLIIKWQTQWHLFSYWELRYIRLYEKIYKFKIYRITWIVDNYLTLLDSIIMPPKYQLTTNHYDGNIAI